jgi:hypothetical protein
VQRCKTKSINDTSRKIENPLQTQRVDFGEEGGRFEVDQKYEKGGKQQRHCHVFCPKFIKGTFACAVACYLVIIACATYH